MQVGFVGLFQSGHQYNPTCFNRVTHVRMIPVNPMMKYTEASERERERGEGNPSTWQEPSNDPQQYLTTTFPSMSTKQY